MDQHRTERPVTSVEVAGVIYDAPKVREHRELIIQMRDAALEQNAMDWAVALSHNIGLLNHLANTLEPSQ